MSECWLHPNCPSVLGDLVDLPEKQLVPDFQECMVRNCQPYCTKQCLLLSTEYSLACRVCAFEYCDSEDFCSDWRVTEEERSYMRRFNQYYLSNTLEECGPYGTEELVGVVAAVLLVGFLISFMCGVCIYERKSKVRPQEDLPAANLDTMSPGSSLPEYLFGEPVHGHEGIVPVAPELDNSVL